MKRNITLWALVIIIIALSFSFFYACKQSKDANNNYSKYNDNNFKYAVSHKVNTLSSVYGDISFMLKRIADGKMTPKEFEYYNYGVNQFIQANNFRMVESILGSSPFPLIKNS